MNYLDKILKTNFGDFVRSDFDKHFKFLNILRRFLISNKKISEKFEKQYSNIYPIINFTICEKINHSDFQIVSFERKYKFLSSNLKNKIKCIVKENCLTYPPRMDNFQILQSIKNEDIIGSILAYSINNKSSIQSCSIEIQCTSIYFHNIGLGSKLLDTLKKYQNVIDLYSVPLSIQFYIRQGFKIIDNQNEYQLQSIIPMQWNSNKSLSQTDVNYEKLEQVLRLDTDTLWTTPLILSFKYSIYLFEKNLILTNHKSITLENKESQKLIKFWDLNQFNFPHLQIRSVNLKTMRIDFQLEKFGNKQRKGKNMDNYECKIKRYFQGYYYGIDLIKEKNFIDEKDYKILKKLFEERMNEFL